MVIGIMRHGQTEKNFENIMQGTTNTSLNDTGRRQCQKIKYEVDKTNYDLCFSSPLLRAFETAMIVVGDKTLIMKDDRLMERGLGDFEGKSREQYHQLHFWDYRLNSNDNGVEPIQEVFQRAQSFLDYLQENYPDKTILIVTHGAMVRALHHLLINSNLEKDNLLIDVPNCFYRKYKM